MYLSKLKRKLDRKMSSGVGGQLTIFAMFFLISLMFIAACYWMLGVGNGIIDSIAKCFSDFLGGDQYAIYAYSKTNATINAPWIKWITLIACIIGYIVYQGLLIATLTSAIQSRAAKVRNGDVRYKFKNHYLILGYDESVPALISKISTMGREIVVVVSKNASDCRNAITDKIGKTANVVVLRGDRNSREDLCVLNVAGAKQVYIIGEKTETNRDLLNIDCYHTITNTIMAEIDCYVQICEQSIYDRVIHSGETKIQYFHPYNLEEIWARRVLIDTSNAYRKIDYQSVENNISVCPDKYVHFVIIGFSAMGEAMLREAALLMHYPNYVSNGIKSRITCVDTNMRQKMQSFIGRHKTLFDCCGYSFYEVGETSIIAERNEPQCKKSNYLDIEFGFVDTNPQNIEFLQQIDDWSNDDKQILSIAICGDEDTYNYQLGYTMPLSVYQKDVPVFLYQKKEYSNQVGHTMYNNVQTFGDYGIDFSIDSDEIRWGKYINYIYQQLYENADVATGIEMLEYSEKLWSRLSIDKRWSNIYNASSLLYKLRGVGIENLQQLASKMDILHDKLDILSEVEHNRWNVEQLMHGYRPTTQSEHKNILDNPVLKSEYKQRYIHDDIRPYSELDEYSKDKDRQLIKYLAEAITKENN